MSKKLNDQQLELIRVRYTGTDTPMGMLIDHIDAIEAEHQAAMTRARDDADRVGAARVEFDDEVSKRIAKLEQERDVAIATAGVLTEQADHAVAFYNRNLALEGALERIKASTAAFTAYNFDRKDIWLAAYNALDNIYKDAREALEANGPG